MKLHYLQHVPFEGLGMIEDWAKAHGAEISSSQLFNGDPLPDLGSFDWLVIMGGPMGIYDHDEHPWLIAEKAFIRSAIDSGKTVLGICLGAQLIADVLGAKVYPGPQKEIGWFPIKRAAGTPDLIPEELTVFHWHGDTFDIPDGAIRLASSAACKNQGFIYGDRVVALQFHLETTEESMEALIAHCSDELANVDAASSRVATDQPEPCVRNAAGSRVYIQTAEEMRTGLPNLWEINAVMNRLLAALKRTTSVSS
ncbi:MAG: type 1 glutamine amidotransferase [Kiritimatiellales bacterium]|nr:type 1 glutamine amidotransferase [Kiritimatiellales bacterium]